MAPYGNKGGRGGRGSSGRGSSGRGSSGGRGRGDGSDKKPSAKKKAVVFGGANPFDVRSNAKTKYEVLGRRVKGTGRNVAAARADAEAKRKKSLAAQFQARHKANAFRDRRLGETDPEMSLEDKMMARFQTERKRKMRNASAFALQDSDDERDGEDELFLTHGGQKIDDYDALNGAGGSAFDDEADEDDETRKMDREIIDKLHFGGGDAKEATGGDHKKTHKEIMQEVMVKSKLFKAERQKNKAAQEDVTDQLDGDFDALKDLLSFRPTKGSKEYDALVREEKKASPPDEFDKLTRELTFEAKAQASERRMTPEEMAKREHDRLSELEKKRVARMNGADEDSDDESGGKKGKRGGKKKPAEIVMLPPQTDDDLAFDYAMDQQFGVREEEEEGEEEEDGEDEDDDEEEDSDADSDEDEDKEGEEEEEEDDEEEAEEDEEEEEEGDEEDQAKAAKKAERKRKRAEAAAELPFVFPCPDSPEDLAALFKEHANGLSERRALIIERIIKFYSVKLAAENQPKMRSFFAILVRQFLKWGKSYAAHKDDLSALAKQLFVLAQDVGDAAGVVVRELLINLYKRLHSNKAASKYPTLAELLLFKALIQVFPTSDLRHNVVSPLETLLSESLAHGGLEARADVTNALFTCTLLLDMTREKQRFTPEVVVFLRKLLRAFVVTESPHWLRTELVEWLEANDASAPLPVLALTEASTASAPAVLRALLSLVDLVATQYAALPSLDELVYPSYLLLHELARSLFADRDGAAGDAVRSVIATVHARLETCWGAREPLRLQTFGPSVLPAFTPKFDANYTVRKDKTLDREKAQTKQLERQVKRARKSAARELRRDASFLAREKQQEEQTRVADKKEKQREIWQWLEEQNATFNQQAKKGGEMLKGGGSGPAKKRRVTARKQ